MGMSIRAYARHRGISDAAVHKAIKQGRISKEPDGTIDSERADKDWLAHTREPQLNIANTAPIGKKRVTPVPQSATQAVRKTFAENGQPLAPDEPITHHHAKEATDILKVEMLRIELEQHKGKLVDCDKVTTHLMQLSRQIRDSWQNWPTRIASVMATELGIDTHTLQTALDKAIRAQLVDVCDLYLKPVEEPAANK